MKIMGCEIRGPERYVWYSRNRLHKIVSVFYNLIFFILAFPATAQQVNTNISSASGIGHLGTVIDRAGNVYTITGGARPENGGNLFHSFHQFSVGAGDTATFLNETGLTTSNILSRVTGGSVSDIFGNIRTSGFPGVNLFLINPAGIIFHEGSVLDIEGSFYASTADSIKLADGNFFHADPNAGDKLLSTASPKSFGFLDKPNPNSVLVQGAKLQVPTGNSISLVSSGMTAVTGGIIDAPNGRITVKHLNAGGEYKINVPQNNKIAPQAEEPKLPENFRDKDIFIRGGVLRISGSGIRTGNAEIGSPGSNITVKVGELDIRNGGAINSSRLGPGGGNAGFVDVDASKSVSIRGTNESRSLITAQGILGGNAGKIEIDTNLLTIEGDESGINANALGGKVGEIGLAVDRLEIRNGGKIQTSNVSDQTGGNIRVTADESVLISGENLTGIASVAGFDRGPVGNAGKVTIQSPNILLEGAGASITTRTEGSGNAGTVDLEVAQKLDVRGGASISSSAASASTGSAGLVSVNAGQIAIRGKDSRVSTASEGSGSAGGIRLGSKTVVIGGGGSITSSTNGPGAGGTIEIDGQGGALTATGVNTQISSETRGSGDAGSIELKSLGNLTLRDGAKISAASVGENATGKGGDIKVGANNIELANGARIEAKSDSSNSKANSGQVRIGFTDTLRMSDGSSISVATNAADAGKLILSTQGGSLNAVGQGTEITSETRGSGGAGSIEAKNLSNLTLRDGAKISAASAGDDASGKGGNIEVIANNIELANGGRIEAKSDSSNPKANSGQVRIGFADKFGMSDGSSISVATNAADAGNIILTTQGGSLNAVGQGTEITSETRGSGDAGSIELRSLGNLTLREGAKISAASTGDDAPGKGGNIEVIANNIELANGGRIEAKSDSSNTKANSGQVRIGFADALRMSDGSSISVATNAADAGDIILATQVGSLNAVGQGTEITSETRGTGNAGSIELTGSSNLTLREGANISASVGEGAEGNGGQIDLNANNIEIIGGGVTASTSGGGAGGGIIINTQGGNLIITGQNASITSETNTSGNAGSIELKSTSNLILRDGAKISASVGEGAKGKGGQIDITANNIEIVGGGVAASTSGAGVGGDITINNQGGSLIATGQNASITTEAQSTGNAGRVEIKDSNILSIRDGAKISASVGKDASGKGGTIDISANNIELTNGARIEARSDSLDVNAESGGITIRFTDNLSIFDNSAISVETAAADAGDININPKPGPKGNILHLRDGTISTSVNAQRGDGGNIFIDPVFTILEGKSRIVANAVSGDGGNIDIQTDFLFQSPDSLIDASSEKGIDGTIRIESPATDIIAGTLPLSEAFAGASAVLAEPCGARLAKTSSFVVGGPTGGLPPGPESMIAASLSNIQPDSTAAIPEAEAVEFAQFEPLEITSEFGTGGCMKN